MLNMLAYPYVAEVGQVKRTTILADEELLLEAKHLAAREGKSLTDVIREALTEYVATHRGHRRLSFIGLGESGNPQLAHQTEEILAAEVDPVQGWAPRTEREAPASERPDNVS
jgi:hypothetical protein